MSFTKLGCNLVANQHVEPAGDGAGRWRALGSDPHFFLQLMRPRRLRGWVCIDADLQLPQELPGHTPYLYVDYGEGMSEATKIPLECRPGGSGIHAMVYFEREVTGLRLDPTDELVTFRLSRVGLRPSSVIGACLWVFQRSVKRNGPSAALREAWRAAGAFIGQLSRFRQGAATRNLAALARSALAIPESAHYQDWIRLYENRQDVPTRLHALEDRPCLSIIMPVFNTPEPWLREAIESVLAQSYENWELCICDDHSSRASVLPVLDEYSTKDKRIRVERRSSNGHIVRATNDAIALAEGEWTVFLDHDDRLHPDALLAIAESASANPALGLIYTDEDKLDAQGRRVDPYFKPDFDAELLLGQNFVCHLMAVRTSVLRDVGGMRLGFEGAQDHDLVLRVVDRLGPERVGHVPRVLYHWRAHAASTAADVQSKEYARTAALKAVQEHLERNSVDARVESLASGHLRVWRAPPSPEPLVSILIPTRDKVELLSKCIDSLRSCTDYPSMEIVVVDNGSEERVTLAYLEELRGSPGCRVIRDDGTFNFSRLNNRAAEAASGEVLLLMNNDIEAVESHWLDAMVAQAMRPEVGAVGALLLYPDNTIQHGGVVLGIGGVAGHVHHRMPADTHGYFGRARLAQRFSAVTAACLAVRRSCWNEVNGMDEGLAVAFNDIDFCLRLQCAGYTNIWTPLARLYHHESASRGSDEVPEKRERFDREIAFMAQRWGATLKADPCYNPNLSLSSQRFELAFPPRAPSGGRALRESPACN